MSDAYKSIEEEYTGEYKDKGSKFFAYLFPIKNEDDFSARLQGVKAEHFKARHHCTALRLRNKTERSSDDGEPSGTAGKPMLNQLLSTELLDVGCVVVRYFGGTKLGVSGLIAAYKGAVADAIANATIVTKYTTTDIIINFDYAVMGSLMDAVKQLEFDVTKKTLTAEASLTITVNVSEIEQSITKLKARMLRRGESDIKEDDKIPGVNFDIGEPT